MTIKYYAILFVIILISLLVSYASVLIERRILLITNSIIRVTIRMIMSLPVFLIASPIVVLYFEENIFRDVEYFPFMAFDIFVVILALSMRLWLLKNKFTFEIKLSQICLFLLFFFIIRQELDHGFMEAVILIILSFIYLLLLYSYHERPLIDWIIKLIFVPIASISVSFFLAIIVTGFSMGSLFQ